MITSSDLLLIQRIVDQGTLTRAADSLFLTQSALSHQLKDLENRIGLPVFDRVNKKLLLTSAGRRMMECAGNILPILTNLNDDIQAYKKGKVHALRISTECYTCYHWLPEVITRLKSQIKNIELTIVAAATQRPLEYLMNGELDLAIITDIPEQSVIRTTNLFADKLVAVLHKDHPYAKTKSSLTAADFASEHLLAYDVHGTSRQFAGKFFRDISPKKITRIQLTEAIVEMINADMGVGLFATWAIAPFLKDKNIITLPLRSPLKKRVWKAAYLDKDHPVIPLFVSAVKEYFQ